MCLISYLCLLCLSTYLSRPSDVFAPYLLRIKVPKSEEGTKEIRSKYGAGGSEKAYETCILKKNECWEFGADIWLSR